MYKEIQNKTFRRSGRCEMNKSRGGLSHWADHIQNIQIFCVYYIESGKQSGDINHWKICFG